MPSLRERLSGAYAGFRAGWREPGSLRTVGSLEASMTLSPSLPEHPRRRYALLRLYAENKVYRELTNALRGVIAPDHFSAIRALENPANQAVLFHEVHVLSGGLDEALPLSLPEDEALSIAASRVFRWSWLETQKDVLVETSAMLGDAFIRAWSTESQAGMEVRDPDDVTEFEEDSQGNIIYIRLDVETADEDGQPLYFTEAWSKEDDLYARWWHKLGIEAPYEQLPTNDSAIADGTYVEKTITSFGYNFVPYVRAPFQGGVRRSTRSQGVFEMFHESIDQNNRDMTVSRDRYFRHGKPLWQSVTGLPKPTHYDLALQEDAHGDGTNAHPDNPDQGRYPDGETFVRNPKDTRLESLVPNIDYAAGLAFIEDGRRALERDISELRFFREDEGGDRSGVALDRLQDPAMHRAASCRANMQAAILKAARMCLTMAQKRGIAGFEEGAIGTFERGDFDVLEFEKRPIRPETASEKSARESAQADSYAALKDVSPELLRLQLLADGFDEETAEKIVGSTQAPRRSAIEGILNGG